MRFDLDRPAGVNLVSAVSPGEIKVGDRIIRTSVIIAAQEIIPDWPVASTRELDEAGLAPVLALAPEIVLLGTGRKLSFPDPRVHARVQGSGIGLEVMDTPAACRTYNILVSEGRRVVAALIVD